MPGMFDNTSLRTFQAHCIPQYITICPWSRVSLLASFMTLAWFLTAHILEFTSVNSCRFSSPHLWWLTFAILCLLYLTIVEIFILGLLVFILGPVIYVRLISAYAKSIHELTALSHSYSGTLPSYVLDDTQFRTRSTSNQK